MRRIGLFLATNFAVMFMLSITTHLLGLAQVGGNIRLLILCAVMGFVGALISLALSKYMAKRSMGVQVISSPSNQTERWLLETVAKQAQQAGIAMPEVGVFHAHEPNAFATGARRNAALVAVSTGLLEQMNADQVEAVLGHEIAHVANGDMVTMTLIQGVLNTFVFFLARVIGNAVNSATRRNNQGGAGFGYYFVVMIAEFVLGLLATMIAAWFSRQREFRADAGGAKLAGRASMIGALEVLAGQRSAGLPASLNAFGITGGGNSLMRKLFATHPPLDERIRALRNA